MMWAPVFKNFQFSTGKLGAQISRPCSGEACCAMHALLVQMLLFHQAFFPAAVFAGPSQFFVGASASRWCFFMGVSCLHVPAFSPSEEPLDLPQCLKMSGVKLLMPNRSGRAQLWPGPLLDEWTHSWPAWPPYSATDIRWIRPQVFGVANRLFASPSAMAQLGAQ